MVVWILIAALPICGLMYLLLTVGRRDARLPPGPPTLPLIGNISQIPRRRSHLRFTELAKIYGGLYTMKAGNSTIAVITDRRIVRELFEEKGSIASNRPASYIVQDIISQGDHLLTLQYGPKWRVQRKLVHQCFMESMCDKHYVHLQHAEAVQMLRDFIVAPGDYMQHPRRYASSVITSIVYGMRIPSIHTTYMERLYEMLDEFTALLEPGAAPPIDFFPFLKFIPHRLMGVWMSRATHVRHIMESLHQSMFQHVINRRREKRGSTSSNTFVDTLLDQADKLGFSAHELSFLGGGLVEGGAETPAALIVSFIQAMTKWPEIQKKAQEEIDSVIGEDRSPTYEDYDRLPYVAALVKECVRWRPVAPLGMPHLLDQDAWIDGKLLPKGTILILNIWGLNHDEKYFSDSQVFDPTRYLYNGQTLPAGAYANTSDYDKRDHYSYGAGRRLCTGIHLAERDLWIAMAMLLWAFDFEQPTDPVTGSTMEPNTDPETGYMEGLICLPMPFPCKVTVRSEARKETIMREFARAEKEVFTKYDENVALQK